MKRVLNYYYNMIVDNINMYNNNYYFSYQSNNFCLYKYTGNLSEITDLFNLNNYMIYNNYPINIMILNKDSNVLTLYNDNYYCLVLIKYQDRDLIDFKKIIDFNSVKINNLQFSSITRSNWYQLWTTKIDNIEYSISHLMHRYKLLYNSVYYYIGLAENAVTYLSISKLENNNLSISHKRVCSKDTCSDLYNPLNLIIDYRIRDLSEYIKSSFFNGSMDVIDIKKYLNSMKMQNEDYVYLYIRMIFPSYYFDLYDKIINGIEKEERIEHIINMQDDYEYLLYEIYLIVRSHISVIGIDWINKKFDI